VIRKPLILRPGLDVVEDGYDKSPPTPPEMGTTSETTILGTMMTGPMITRGILFSTFSRPSSEERKDKKNIIVPAWF